MLFAIVLLLVLASIRALETFQLWRMSTRLDEYLTLRGLLELSLLRGDHVRASRERSRLIALERAFPSAVSQELSAATDMLLR